MSIKVLDHEFLFVGKGENGFLENYAFEEKENKEGKGGKVFMAMELLNNPLEGEKIGQAIFDALKEVFFKHFSKDPYVRFEEALKDINNLVRKYKDQRESKSIGIINVVIGAINGNKLFLSQNGESEAYLIRGRFVTIISEGLSSPDKTEDYDLFENIASGTIEPGDYLIFSTSRLLRYITKVDLGKAFAKKDLLTCLDELKNIIVSEVASKIAVIGVNAKRTKDTENESMAHEVTEEYILAPKGQAVLPRGVYIKAVSKFFQDLLNKVSPKRASLSRDKLLIIAVSLAVVIVFGIVFLQMKNSTQEYIQKQEAILNEAQSIISDAESKSHFDKKQAAALLQTAESKAVEVLNSGELSSRVKGILERIEELRDDMDSIHRITNPRIIADMTERKSDVNALGIIPFNDRLFVYEYNAIYEVVMDRIEDPINLTTENEAIVTADFFDDKNGLVFYTNKNKIIEYSNDFQTYMDTEDGTFRSAEDIATYGNKVYLLDPSSNQIWKYTRKRDNYSQAEKYLLQDYDLQKAVSFAIDGGVYVLNSDGNIDKYYSGEKETFQIAKPPIDYIERPTKIYTAIDLNQIYILEPGKSRVIVLTKDSRIEGANYTSQYVFEGTGELKDLYVTQDGKLYVIDSTKLYLVELN